MYVKSSCSSALRMVTILYFSLSNRYVVIFHFCFNLHFPNRKWYWISVLMMVCHPYILSGKVFIQLFFPFIKLDFLTVEFRELLTHFGYNHFVWLLDTWFASIFSQSMAHLFHSLQHVSQREKGINSDKVYFIQFFMLCIVLSVSGLRTVCLITGHKNFYNVSSKTIIILHFTFRYMIQLS